MPLFSMNLVGFIFILYVIDLKKTTYYKYTKTALLLGTIHLRRPQFGGRSGLGQISLK